MQPDLCHVLVSQHERNIMLFILSVVIAVVAFVAWRGAARKVKEGNLSLRSLATLAVLACALFSLVAVSQFLTQIPAGHVGVVDFFGIVSERTLPPGINVINPLARVHEFSVQTREHKEAMEVLSREGLTIGLEISVLVPAESGFRSTRVSNHRGG